MGADAPNVGPVA